MWSRITYFILPVLAFSLPEATLAQSVYGTIKGTLTYTGAPVSQALVLVSALDKGDRLSFFTRTDDSGFFTFSNVPSGVYSMRMQKDGFKTHVEPLVPVSADNSSEVNVKLARGDAADKELGDGSAVSILKVDRADVSTRFSRQEIDSLPLFRQNVSRYELLVPGAVRTRNVLADSQNPQAGIYASLSGQHFSGTTFLLDGTVNRDPLEGIVVLNPSIDLVSELKVTTQNYSPEFGPATGGVVSVQSRSGTNNWHGSAFGYSLPDFTQASLPSFGQTSLLQSASEKRSEFGGSLGGALVRNRLFVFGDYRGIRRSEHGTVLLTVPTNEVHKTCTGVASSTTPCDLSEYKVALTDPFSKNVPFPKNQIPNSLVSPQMVAFLDMIPLPTATGVTNNFMNSGVDALVANTFDVRSDYVASSKLKAFGRYSFANFRESGSPAFGTAGGTGANNSGFAGVMRDRNQGISAGFSLNLTSSILTDFRFGFLRYNLRIDSLDIGTTPATQAGIQGLNLPGDLFSSGMPDIQLDNPNLPTLPIAGSNQDFVRLGYSPVANTCNCPLREREQQFQFVNNWTKLVGKHDIRWGADFRYLQNFRLSSDQRRAGHFEFGNTSGPGNMNGLSLADFLLGTLSAFSQAYNNNLSNPAAYHAGERQTRMFFYGEDTWRVNSRLSVNYGLRWEVYLPQAVTASGAGGWLQLGSGATPANDQFVIAGQAGANLQGNVKTTLRNIGPRVGFAYLANPTTVIRAGYAREFDPGYGGTIFGIAATQSPPVGVIATFKSFTVNSNRSPLAPPGQVNICQNGTCTVPAFQFHSTAPFTINDLRTDNKRGQQADLYALPGRLRLPTVDAWNFALQHALDRHTYVEISYVGNKGTHVLNDDALQVPYYDLNQPTLVGFIAPTQPKAANCQNPRLVGNNPFCKTLAALRQPFQPWTSQIRYFGSDASSNYNSLQVKVRRQFTSGFSLLANYTFSKVIDFDNLFYAINPEANRGVGNFDRRHNFVMTNTWDLPIGRGRTLFGSAGPVLNRVVSGWSLAGTTSWSSGLPFTPIYSECAIDIGASQFSPCRPNLVGHVHITDSRSQYFTTTVGQFLHASCMVSGSGDCPSGTIPALQGFDPKRGQPLLGQTIGPWQRPGAGQIGDAARNSLRGPGFFQSDLAVAKNILITERVVVQFRADAFNVFNNVNLGNPNPNVDSGGGGQITSLAIGAIQREMQFSLRLEF